MFKPYILIALTREIGDGHRFLYIYFFWIGVADFQITLVSRRYVRLCTVFTCIIHSYTLAAAPRVVELVICSRTS